MANHKVTKGQMAHGWEEPLRDKAPSCFRLPGLWDEVPGFVSGRNKKVRNISRNVSFLEEVTVFDGKNTCKSPRKEVKRGETARTIKDVELRKAQDARGPSVNKVKEDQDSEEAVTQELFHQMSSILNKLTPEKFERLMKEIKRLSINTVARLEGIGKMVLDKAICEVKLASTYAKMCCELKKLALPVSDSLLPLDFHAVILDLCQVEFRKVTGDGAVLEKEWRNHRPAKGEDRQDLQELRAKVTAHRKRAVGSMKFIGELFKLGMVKDGVILEYVTELIDTKTEEAMECLSCLITTADSILDSVEIKPEMDRNFKGIESILQEKTLTSRVCSMLQDLVDLRQKKLAPKVEERRTKTTRRICKEVQKESPVKQISKTYLKKSVPRDEGEPKPISRPHKKTKVNDQPGTSKAPESLGSEFWEQDEPREEQLSSAVQTDTEPAVEAASAEESRSEHAVDRDPEFPVVLESELTVESESKAEVKIESELAIQSETDLAAESELVSGIDSEQAKEIESEPILLASESLGSEFSAQDEPCEEQLSLAVQMDTEPAVEAEPAEESRSEHAVDPDPEFPVVLESELTVESESKAEVKIESELAIQSESDLAAESELVSGIDSEQAKEIESEPILLASESLGSEFSAQDEPCEEQLRLSVQMEMEPTVDAEPAEESRSEHAVDPDPEFPAVPESELTVESESKAEVKIESELAIQSETDLAAESELVSGIDSEQAKEIESEPILLIPNGETQGAVHDVASCVDSEHQMALDRTEFSPAKELAREVLEEYFMRYCTATLLEGQEEEEALECLCRLLPTICRKMDIGRAKCLIDKCIRQLEDILKEGKTSNRIRLMIQDIMNLRQNNWAPRDSNQESKATSQVHKDAELENQQERDKVEQQLVHTSSNTHHEHTSEQQRTCKEHDREVKEYRGEHQGNRAHQGQNGQQSGSNERHPAHEIQQRWNYGEHNSYGQDLRRNRREHQVCTQDQRWYHGEHQGRAQDQRWHHGEHVGHVQDQRWHHGEHEGRAQDQRWYHGQHQGHAQDQRWYHGQHQGHAQDQRWHHGEHEGRVQDQRWHHGEHQGRAQDQRWYHGQHQGHAQDQRWHHGEHEGRAQDQRWNHKGFARV